MKKSGPSGHWGFTEDGTRFDVPDTLNTLETFLPHNLSLGSAISLTLILTSIWLTLCCNLDARFNIALFFFWRLAYNVGLGVILNSQSQRRTFQKLYLTLYGDGKGWQAGVLDHLAIRQLPAGLRAKQSIRDYPQVFRAWLVYKNLVNIILVNDGATYILLGLKYFNVPGWSDLTPLVFLQYAVGLFLCLFNYWAKVDAHRCIGEFCWFWGDFFFRKDLHLTFDGIFELFPHPMYTVGYSLYYGYSLLARSYPLLFCSLLAHCCQLLFLVLVEEPHIKRTYGSPPALDKSKARVLYDPKSGLFPDKSDNVFFGGLDLFRSGDFAVVLVAICSVIVALVPESPGWALGQVYAWRAIHWFGLGYALWGQSASQLWTRHFTTKGRTIYEAFGHWKNTYNLSLTINIVTFVVCALRYAAPVFYDSWSWTHGGLPMSHTACCAVGVGLICLSVWSYLSTWDAIGEFGWFYGDFFISEDSFRQHLCYTGIYRFLNNPDCVTGYAGQYGLALIAQSWEVFFVALVSHILNILFLNLVEIPHMEKLYSEREMRQEAPFPKALKRMQETVETALPKGLLPQPIRAAQTQLERDFKVKAREVRAAAMEQMFKLVKKYKDVRVSRKKKKAENAAASNNMTVPASPLSPRSARNVSGSATVGAVTSSSSNGVKLSSPAVVTLGDSLVLQYSAPVVPRPNQSNKTSKSGEHAGKQPVSYDWIGVYPVSVPSAEGASEGCYQYVEPCSIGEAVFPPLLLPAYPGEYEARYHRNNSYTVEVAHRFTIEALEDIEESPQGSPGPQSEQEEEEEEDKQTTTKQQQKKL